MAAIDYGSIVKKNGKIIQTEMFMSMIDMVGFELEKAEREYKDNREEMSVSGNYTSYMGDKELLICTYKCRVSFIIGDKIIRDIYDMREGAHMDYKPMSLRLTINGVDFHIKRLFNQNRYQMKFKYKGDFYDCIFGYGVDLNLKLWYYISEKEKRYIRKWMYGK